MANGPWAQPFGPVCAAQLAGAQPAREKAGKVAKRPSVPRKRKAASVDGPDMFPDELRAAIHITSLIGGISLEMP